MSRRTRSPREAVPAERRPATGELLQRAAAQADRDTAAATARPASAAGLHPLLVTRLMQEGRL